jgi:chromosome segregation ATPase
MSPHRGGNVISGPDIDKLTQRLIDEATAELRQELKDTQNKLKQARGELGAAQRTNSTERAARKAAENTLASLQRDAAETKERRLKLLRINAHYRAQLVNAGITPWKPEEQT